MIEVRPCPSHPGAVDLWDTRAAARLSPDVDEHPDPIHLSAAEWAEFTAAVKGGRYDQPG